MSRAGFSRSTFLSAKAIKMDSRGQKRRERGDFSVRAASVLLIGKSLQLTFLMDRMMNYRTFPAMSSSFSSMTSYILNVLQGFRNSKPYTEKYGAENSEYPLFENYLKRVPRISFRVEKKDKSITSNIDELVELSNDGQLKRAELEFEIYELNSNGIEYNENEFSCDHDSDEPFEHQYFIRSIRPEATQNLNYNGPKQTEFEISEPNSNDMDDIEIEFSCNDNSDEAREYQFSDHSIQRGAVTQQFDEIRSEKENCCLSKQKPELFNIEPLLSLSLTKEQLMTNVCVASLSAFLRRLRIKHKIAEYREKRNRQDSNEIFCKNLLLKDRNGNFYYLICDENKSVNMKKAAKLLGAYRNLSFASSDETDHLLHLKSGEITPFALMHKTATCIKVSITADIILDEEALLNFHPFDSKLTLAITLNDLQKYLTAFKHELHFLPL
ncbi:uncharacterized protein LOC126824511 [Patella vulgata]|uniref:uncharacterized protein LOC126824511 n=1 Tax=Patella vulgata TaxID=6465 RepID=UPI00217FFC36|nr:uncharacterized protein LOC126824511 [Patella vulgata]